MLAFLGLVGVCTPCFDGCKSNQKNCTQTQMVDQSESDNIDVELENLDFNSNTGDSFDVDYFNEDVPSMYKFDLARFNSQQNLIQSIPKIPESNHVNTDNSAIRNLSRNSNSNTPNDNSSQRGDSSNTREGNSNHNSNPPNLEGEHDLVLDFLKLPLISAKYKQSGAGWIWRGFKYRYQQFDKQHNDEIQENLRLWKLQLHNQEDEVKRHLRTEVIFWEKPVSDYLENLTVCENFSNNLENYIKTTFGEHYIKRAEGSIRANNTRYTKLRNDLKPWLDSLESLESSLFRYPRRIYGSDIIWNSYLDYMSLMQIYDKNCLFLKLKLAVLKLQLILKPALKRLEEDLMSFETRHATLVTRRGCLQILVKVKVELSILADGASQCQSATNQMKHTVNLLKRYDSYVGGV